MSRKQPTLLSLDQSKAYFNALNLSCEQYGEELFVHDHQFGVIMFSNWREKQFSLLWAGVAYSTLAPEHDQMVREGVRIWQVDAKGHVFRMLCPLGGMRRVMRDQATDTWTVYLNPGNLNTPTKTYKGLVSFIEANKSI